MVTRHDSQGWPSIDAVIWITSKWLFSGRLEAPTFSEPDGTELVTIHDRDPISLYPSGAPSPCVGSPFSAARPRSVASHLRSRGLLGVRDDDARAGRRLQM